MSFETSLEVPPDGVPHTLGNLIAAQEPFRPGVPVRVVVYFPAVTPALVAQGSYLFVGQQIPLLPLSPGSTWTYDTYESPHLVFKQPTTGTAPLYVVVETFVLASLEA